MKVHTLKLKDREFTQSVGIFISTILNKQFKEVYSYGNQLSSSKLKEGVINIPIHVGKQEIAFDFMEAFIAKLKAERIAKLKAYLKAAGLDDCTLTEDEQQSLNDCHNIEYGTFNLKDLFGGSSRGRRLKSSDRVHGNLPFVTAGECDTGISAYIGNSVHVFNENTITIDMFGSAKYRIYRYGADDHVAVVHTEHLPKFAALYLTAAINKVSHSGQFDYSRNFYASDADELNISLPINPDNSPNYDFMKDFMSAMQKIVIKNMVDNLDIRIQKTTERSLATSKIKSSTSQKSTRCTPLPLQASLLPETDPAESEAHLMT
jgi:hypothetical protein